MILIHVIDNIEFLVELTDECMLVHNIPMMI